MGPSKEQKLDINFVQRIGSGIYIGVNARFAKAPGRYTNQKVQNAGANFYTAFLHPKQRYGIIFTYRTDRGINYENGGLTSQGINDFKNNSTTDRKQIPVNLENAENRTRVRGIVLQQYFNILKPTVTKKVDTITTQVPRKFDAGRIVYTLRTSRTGNTYQDQAPPSDFYSFYPSYFADTVPIFDSILVRHIENCLVYSNEVPDTLGKSFPLQYSFGLRFQTDRMTRDTTINDIFRQTVPFGMLKGIIRHKTFFKASAFLVLGGYNSGAYSLEGSFYQFFGKQNHKIYLNVTKGLTHPDYFFTNYYTDYFQWNYSFNAQNYFKGEFGVILSGFDLNASYTRLTDYVYLNQKILPTQYSDALNILAGHVSKEFRLKHWITTVYAGVQQSSPDSILQLPAVTGKLTLCYDVVLFNNALHTQIGVSGTYNSKWYQDAYMPALRAFYRQDEVISGNYPYLDAFVNLNIKRARLFVKYEHFNASFMGNNYIMVPSYPQADAAFILGVSWLFFD